MDLLPELHRIAFRVSTILTIEHGTKLWEIDESPSTRRPLFTMRFEWYLMALLALSLRAPGRASIEGVLTLPIRTPFLDGSNYVNRSTSPPEMRGGESDAQSTPDPPLPRLPEAFVPGFSGLPLN
jgi:hypothetical protein